MDKDLNSPGDEFAFFQNLPDELVMVIFTRLSNSDTPFDTLNDLKSLGQCSTVCKRFNSLVSLVCTLTISHPCCKTLYDLCPKILNKFKDIRSLQVKHWSLPELRMNHEDKKLPFVLFDAAYRPHNYCIAVLSYKNITYYRDRQVRDQLMLLDVYEDGDDDLYASTKEHTFDLIRLHHMLVSSIRDHKYLQMVLVTDIYNRGTFSLEKDILVELRNCSSINLEQVMGRDISGPLINLDFPFMNNPCGVVLNNICFNIIEWYEKSAVDHHMDAAGGIPTGLPFNGHHGYLLKTYLETLLENPAEVGVNDGEVILGLLSDMKSGGNLL